MKFDGNSGFLGFGVLVDFDTSPLIYIGLSEISDLGFSDFVGFGRNLRIVQN